MTPREILDWPEFPPAAHELAAILQFGTSYELVEWLAWRLHEVSEQMAQEHKENVMIQKALVYSIEPEDQQEINRIGWQRIA